MKLLVTGSNGFIGSALLRHLGGMAKYNLVAALRRQAPSPLTNVEIVKVADLAADTDWKGALKGVGAVIHLAARVHVMNDASCDPLVAFRQVNVDGTLNLARQAAAAGVERFIFLSSIKVNGEVTLLGRPFTENDPPAPHDPYGISKYEAEAGLYQLAAATGLAVTIIRPPLVYGPGVKANFRTMMRWVGRGVPLPLGAIKNKRSLVALDNLIDLITISLENPAAINQTFLAGDGEDLSTTELLRRVALAMGKSSRLVPVPMFALQGVAALLGKRAMMQRLCESLQVDISKARNVLGWEPPVTVSDGIRRTVAEIDEDF